MHKCSKIIINKLDLVIMTAQITYSLNQNRLASLVFKNETITDNILSFLFSKTALKSFTVDSKALPYWLYQHFSASGIPQTIQNVSKVSSRMHAASKTMARAEAEAENLCPSYWDKEVDQSYVDRFTVILHDVEQANKCMPIPEKLNGNLRQLIFFGRYNKESKKKLAELILPITQHRSSMSKLLTYDYFEALNPRSSKNYEAFRYSTSAYQFTEESAEIVLGIKLAKCGDNPRIYSGDKDVLKTAIQEIIKSGPTAFSVMVFRPDPASYHVVPVILRFENKKLEILITDSLQVDLGKNDDRSWKNETLQHLDKIFSDTGIEGSLYLLNVQRLYNTDNCMEFTLSDIVQYFKLKQEKKRDLFEEAMRNSTYAFSLASLKVRIFDRLPAPMLRLTQSEKVIEKQLKDHPELERESASFNRHQTLRESFHAHPCVVTYFSKKMGKKVTQVVNNRADISSVKDITLLFFHYFPELKPKDFGITVFV